MQNNAQDQTQNPPRGLRMRDFFYHLLVYVFVLALIGIATGSTGGAFMWLALFWGFAVAAHGIYAYFG